MSSSTLFSKFINLLLEKGGKRSKKGNKIKFYIPELSLEDKETKLKYEISSIDKTDPNNMIFTLERFDDDGRKVSIQKDHKEILKNYKNA